jgi:hypothetical protein
MLLHECFYKAVSGPIIEYLKMFKKFSRGAELQPLRASPTLSFPQTCRFLEAGQGGGWGCGPEQLAATVPCAHVYSGCIAMARRTQLLAVFCKYSTTLWVLQRESWSSISKCHIIHRCLYHIIYIITANSCVRLQTIL